VSDGDRRLGTVDPEVRGCPPDVEKVVTALVPVRAYLLREASAEADQIRAAARAEADELCRQARLDAEHAVRDGAARGRAEAAPLAAAERSRGRAAAQSIVFGAQREAYDELCRRIGVQTDSLRADPGFRLMLERLTALAARTAGLDATVTPLPDGGVLARSGHVVVDCSLPRLAGEAAHALGDRVRELWEP
jgi:vacuolar-type H+-ATPase subunit E/Vma4